MGVANPGVRPGGADFRLMNRAAVDALRSLPEYHRFLRGMVSWIGFRSVVLPYQPAARLGGESKYSLRKMLRLGQDAIFSFSLVPLYAAISVGGLFLVLALAEMIYVLSFWITGRTEKLAPGWSSLMFVLLVVGGNRLGCVNHASLTLRWARAVGLTVAGYVINTLQPEPDLAMQTNVELLHELLGPSLGVFPWVGETACTEADRQRLADVAEGSLRLNALLGTA
jgi:hypothetical protein